MAIQAKQLADNTITSDKIDETGTLSTVNAGDAASDGSAQGIPKKDHQHAVATAAPPATSASAAAPAEGSSSDLMRSDASIQVDVSGTLDELAVGATSSDGTGNGVALKTHQHAVPAATAVELTDSTNDAGNDGNFVHANHQHAHGTRGGGTLHAAATPSVAGFLSAADKTKLDTLIDPNLRDPKDSVRLLQATGNVTPLSGATLVDGVAPAPGERVAVFGQSTPAEDGIYVAAAGAWSRAADFQAATGQAGAVIPVEEGSANADTIFLVTNDVGSDVVGTHDLVVLKIAAGTPRGAGAGLVLNVNDLDVVANADGSIVVNANDVQVGVLATDAQHGARGGGTQHANAVPAGAAGFMTGADKTKLDNMPAFSALNQEVIATEVITGTDTALADTLDNTPIDVTAVGLYLNGVLLREGAGNDYTISGTTITWLASTGTAPNMNTNDDLTAIYLS